MLKKILLTISTLLCVNSSLAFTELNLKIEEKKTIDYFFLNDLDDKEIEIYLNSEKNNFPYSYVESSSSNFNMETMATDAIFMISNYFINDWLPDDWEVDLMYKVEEEDELWKRKDEVLLINVEKKLKL